MQNGHLYRSGKHWRLRFRAGGRHLNRVVASSRVTKSDAIRAGRQLFLDDLEQLDAPAARYPFDLFIRHYYLPHLERWKKTSTLVEYRSRLRRMMNAFGSQPLGDLRGEDVERLLAAELARGLSVRSARHLLRVLSAVYSYAVRAMEYRGANPAAGIRLPDEAPRRPPFAYSIEQARAILAALPPVVFEASHTALTTGLSGTELRGLRWRWVNLSSTHWLDKRELIPPLSAAIREDYLRGEYTTLKRPSRRREVNLPPRTAELLGRLREVTRFSDLEDPVFASLAGTPFSPDNVTRRIFRPLGRRLGLPINWHLFRHTHATWLEKTGCPMSDRAAQLGHARTSMTMHYTHADALDARRQFVSELERWIV